MNKDILIVGQGLAGTVFAWQCMQAGKSIHLVDQHSLFTSSKVAAGMFTPVSGKRMAKSWMAETLIPYAISTYEALAASLNQPILCRQHIYQVIASVKEQNDLMTRLEDKAFADYLITNPEAEPGLKEPFGAFEVKQSGWVNLPLLLESFQQLLLNAGQISLTGFNYNNLVYHNEKWDYDGLTYSHIVFCEGHLYHQNPYFASLIPNTPTKGDVLTIRCTGLTEKKIIKKGIYLISLGDHLYKVGSTYERDQLNNGLPSEEAKHTLTEKLSDFLAQPFEVIDHRAGIRPTTRDRKPLLGQHPAHPNMYIFNGLGAKGVMMAPWFANLMMEHIFEQKALPKEVSIDRFK